ncbi:polysaccharide deacetylase family protein [Cronbergia sp. UHCC 0137]|uniref:polysaccharide deacetylase family protein n=1 Tax=Cronbergia sp. UHCC 0137 TaxID=3110239 RepID=UPI002B2132B3|nr:polysaccharide deacetylase family protein [Cronbergia sp. UHCC 0137]MEA5621049.1 polysaccharide deacetylase family protein [Cronbergia sp. UHCC 0137]
MMTLNFQHPAVIRMFWHLYSKGILSALIWLLSSCSGLAAATSPSINQTESACVVNRGVNDQIANFANILPLVSTWLTQPDKSVQTLIERFGPYLFAFITPSPWPNIHEQAKLAKVPIMMYHDILPEKEVFFDVTPTELEEHFKLIKEQGVTPISLDQLMIHLQTKIPLPEKPILLTFDDGYGGHYEYVYPLLKKYGYPAVFSIYTKGVGNNVGRSHVSWEQLKEMAVNPLVTIASHSVTHPDDLTKLPEDELKVEIIDSKRILEENLGIPIRYFTYPVGKYNELVADWVKKAGYDMGLTMSDADERFAGESESLLAVSRFGQSSLKEAIAQAWGGTKLPSWQTAFDFTSLVRKVETTINKMDLILISGGQPITIHADSRYQLPDMLAKSGTRAIAAVDGTFFSLKYLTSNVIVGPVLSQTTKQFVPGDKGDNKKMVGRPLVLINPYTVRFIPFDPDKHNTLEGVQAEMADVTDAFVAGAWLVREGQPQAAETFNGLFGFDAARYRAFWGINQDKQPTIGISRRSVDSISLGIALAKAGLQDAVMLDSGQSASLAFQGESLTDYTPRPVPHAIALIPPPSQKSNTCILATEETKN